MPDVFVLKKQTKQPKLPLSENSVSAHEEKSNEQTLPLSFLKQYPPTPLRMLSSFCPHPEGITFQNQDADEIVLLFLRRHLITNLPWITLTIALLIAPIILQALAVTAGFSLFDFLPSAFTTILSLFYYLLVTTVAFLNFITWYYNISLVTNKKIIDIDFSDLLYHNVAATKTEQIEDVDYTQSGFIRTLFNYGDVFLQTAGESRNFDFLAVPNPTLAIDIIVDLIGAKKHP